MTRITIIGAGSWGTGLGVSLAARGHQVRIWGRSENALREMEGRRENKRYLPGVPLPEKLAVVYRRKEALAGAETVIFAVPAQHFREALTEALPDLGLLPGSAARPDPGTRPDPGSLPVIINVAKGIEQVTLMRQSEIAAQLLSAEGAKRYVALSGPSHAEEVGRALPTTLVAAAADRALAEEVQDIVMSERLRVYTSTDLTGVELGGALKNIIALGAGIADGLGFGDNTKAAMMTRGIVEISRLGIALGAREDTFYGLAGIGDLIVTCTSMHSRNRRCGILIGEGLSPAAAMEKVGMAVEGIHTTGAAYALAKKMGVSMPITEHIYAVLEEGMDPAAAVESLMTRRKKHERAEEIACDGQRFDGDDGDDREDGQK